MLLAAESVAATFFALVFVAVVVGVPISIAVTNNRRHAEATRYAHMEGWAHGTPLGTAHLFQGGTGGTPTGVEHVPDGELGTAHLFQGGAPSETPGPRIVAYGTGPTGRAIRIVNSPAPPRPDPGALSGHPLVIVPRPGPEDVTAVVVQADMAVADEARAAGERREPDHFDTALSFVPPVPASPPEGTAEAQVLGHPRVLGWIAEPARRNSTELCCYLALHPERPMSQDECRMALGSGEGDKPDAAAKTVRNTIWALRQGLGRELVPDGGKAGYQLSEKVKTDWAKFQQSIAMATPGSASELDGLIAALAMVRGAPFEGVAAGSYAWAWSELWVPRMETAIIDAARRVASLALAAGEPGKASWAALQGLLAVPHDIQLWTVHVEAASARGRSELERAMDHARSVLGEEAEQLRSHP